MRPAEQGGGAGKREYEAEEKSARTGLVGTRTDGVASRKARRRGSALLALAFQAVSFLFPVG